MKKILALILATLALISTTACSTNTQQAETRMVTDAMGRKVEVPLSVDRIVPLGNAPRMICYLGLANRVVGIEECEIATDPIQAYAYPHADMWRALPNCGTNSMGETAYYPEQIMLADPDVILTTDNADIADDLQAQTGIPVVCVEQGTLFGDDYDRSLRILAEVCGVSDRAEALIAYIDATLEDLADRAATVSANGKPSVLGAGATFKGSHSIDGVYTNYAVFEVLAANDVAEEIAGDTGSSGVMVDREQILLWDPEIIFFDAGSMGLIHADYEENSGYFEQLQAVKNGSLYQWPNSTWHWSNVEIPLVSAYYVGTLLYPDAFADVDFDAKASEIFDMFLGQPDYLTVLENAGSGYGKVTLGE